MVMIMRYEHLSQHPKVFSKVTGLTISEFDELVADLLSRYAEAEEARLQRPDRQRDIGAGRKFELDARNQVLLVVIWLRIYPTGEVLGYLFGVSAPTVSRIQSRVLPLLEQAGQDTMRLPDPGRKRRRQWSELLHMIPELTVVVDTFEQAVQRPQNHDDADAHYSGKKKQHTLKSQVAVDANTGYLCAVSESVHGPTADIKLLEDCGLLDELPDAVGVGGDLAYIKLAKLRQKGFSPRRKPRGKPRPVADIIYNRVFSHFRIIVEHTIGRMRRFQAISQRDRHHRRHHTARTRAIAGLVNRHLLACGVV
jgi:hypothetical protein